MLNVLYDYTDFHFSREERMMGAAAYPDLENHKKNHAGLKNKVMEIRDSYNATETAGLEDATMKLLKDWLQEHIMGRDQLYRAAMAEHMEAVMETAESYNSADVWHDSETEDYDDPLNPDY